MLSKFFTSLGWTRDDATWLWMKVLAIATLVTTGTVDVPYWSAYLGVPISVTAVHWIQAVAVAIGWIGAQNGNSSFPGKNDASKVTTFPRPPAA